ncbi:MAG TPA: DUF6265 family protein [Casimicrobiaceae bacterium]|nr:DUF6265 family protein [Casimicrobiaceae bacterium]
MLKYRTRSASPIVLAVLAATAWISPIALGQPATPAGPAAPPADAAAPSERASLDALGWLRGCWLGSVNRREFLEQWSPPRGGMMVGFSHTIVAPKFQGTVKDKMEAAGKPPADPSKDRTQDFEYLRLEQRADGVYYVAVPSGKKEVVFKLSDVSEESGAKVFTFTNVVDEFPQRISYRRGAEGWLYAQVTGKTGVAGSDVVYPMQHIDCATEALLKE